MVMPTGGVPAPLGNNMRISANQAIYPRKITLDFPIEILSFALSAGTLAVSQAIDANALLSQATNFYGLFMEYCLVGMRLEFRVGATITAAQGLYLAYIDEINSGAPTLLQAQSRPHIEGLISPSESPSCKFLQWKAQDYLDLTWNSCSTAGSTPYVPAYFKIFASPAGTATSASTVASILVTGTIRMQFRGLGA
jgi:hypothetical protein